MRYLKIRTETKPRIYKLGDNNDIVTQEPPTVVFDQNCMPSVFPDSRQDFREQLKCIKEMRRIIKNQISRDGGRVRAIHEKLTLTSQADPQVSLVLDDNCDPVNLESIENRPHLLQQKRCIKAKISKARTELKRWKTLENGVYMQLENFRESEMH